MAKMSALGSNFYVGIYDISGDIGALTGMETSQVLGNYSSILSMGTERKGHRLDGSMGWVGFWNPAAAASVDILGDVGTQVMATFLAPGTGVGRFAASLVALPGTFAAANGQDGSLGITGQMQGSAGHPVEWGYALTAGKETIASAANGSAVDRTDVSTDFGLAAYIHVLSIGSGTANVKVQDSANGTSGWADIGAAFTAISGPTTERIATAVATENVRRYLRYVAAGTFTNLVCVINAVPYRQ